MMKGTTSGRVGLMLAVAVGTASAMRVDLDQPKATLSVNLPLDGMTPKPTVPPSAHEYLRNRRRAAGDDDDKALASSAIFAPDSICGYIDGRVGAAYECPYSSQTCVLFPPPPKQVTNTYSGFVGCCDSDHPECNFKADCIDFDQYYSQSLCDDACDLDIYTLKCSLTEAQFCNTVTFEGKITDYWCGSKQLKSIQAALTTIKGGDDREYNTITLDGDSSTLVSFESTIGASQTKLVGPRPTDSSATAPKATGVSKSGDEDGGDDEKDNDSDGNDGDNDDDKKKKTPVGAIAGGVVGGVAAIGLGATAIFLFLRRKKSKSDAAKGGSSQVSPMQQYGAPTAGAPPPGVVPQPYKGAPDQAYYNNAAYAGQGGMQPYPPQQGQMGPGGYYPQQHPSPIDPSQTASPTMSQMTDPRASMAPTSPSPSHASYNTPANQAAVPFQPQEGVIHEAPTTNTDNHRGQMHELA